MLVHVGFAYLSNARILTNNTVGEVSAQYESLFTPAGITFSIWGIIYTSLLAFCVFHVAMAWRHPENHLPNRQVRKIGLLFLINNLLSALWLWVWTNELIGWSVLIIICQLSTLLVIHLRLSIYDPNKPVSSRIFTQFPLSIYLGWLTIATIANISSYLVAVDWDPGPMGAGNWTRLMIAVAVLLGSLVIFTRRNVFFGLVFVWALYGLVIKRQQENNGTNQAIIRAAWIGIALLIIIIIIQWVRNITYKRTRRSVPVPASIK